MAEWRLTSRSESVLAGWKKTATPAHQRRLADVFQSIGDGTWKTRWWNQPYPDDTDLAEIRAGDGLIVLMNELLDGEEPIVWIELAGVWVVDDDEADLGFPRD